MAIFASRAMLPAGWSQGVRVTIAGGEIAGIEAGAAPQPTDHRVDTLLPALSNLHSHGFQRAMAGMTEHRARGRESFWTWRDLMYRFLDRLTPDHVQAIAAQAFVEMQEAGYAAVGEFHYVHHAPGGAPYGDLAELSHRVMAAAAETGIGLTHLPVLYSYGGVDGAALQGGQLRFGNAIDRYLDLHRACSQAARDLPPDTRIGVAPHSLRATNGADLARLLTAVPGGPVHIHIAEQTQEVAEVEAHLGARPVAWLMDHAPVGPRWCLIHATHMVPAEVAALAQSGAVAGLCPVTEANLGDGIFEGAAYRAADGAMGIGTDSNVNIGLSEELRSLEYSQRLRDRARNVLALEGGSTGAALYRAALRGGAQALGRDAGAIEVGKLADLVAIDGADPTLLALQGDQLLDGWVFAARDRVGTDLWSAGRHRVTGGQHAARAPIRAAYRATMADLMDQ